MTYRSLSAILFTLVAIVEAYAYLATDNKQYAVLMALTVALSAVVSFSMPVVRVSRTVVLTVGGVLVAIVAFCVGLWVTHILAVGVPIVKLAVVVGIIVVVALGIGWAVWDGRKEE